MDNEIIMHKSLSIKCFIKEASCSQQDELDVSERGSNHHSCLKMVNQKQCHQVTLKHRYLNIYRGKKLAAKACQLTKSKQSRGTNLSL